MGKVPGLELCMRDGSEGGVGGRNWAGGLCSGADIQKNLERAGHSKGDTDVGNLGRIQAGNTRG